MDNLSRLGGLLCLLAAGLGAPVAGAEWAGAAERLLHDRTRQDPLIMPAGGRDAVICRYRSRAGNCFRLMRADHSRPVGAVSAPLHGELEFRQFVGELLFEAGGLRICEIAENWSPWRAVAAAARQTPKVAAEERFCSPGIVSDAPACPCRSLRESRRRPAFQPRQP